MQPSDRPADSRAPSARAAAEPPGILAAVAQSLSLGFFYTVSRTVTGLLNTTRVLHGERFLETYNARPPGVGLITVSNHVTSVDDPGAIAPLVPAHWLLTPDRFRYTLCARERCFSNPFIGAVLSAARVLPVERGRGPLQPDMDLVVGHLDRGAWVHVFPEGTRGDGAPGQPIGPLRPGVGRLVADAAAPPVVLPIFHRGLHRVMHRGHRLPVSEVGVPVDIIVGQPVAGLGPLVQGMREAGAAEREVHAAVTARIGAAIEELRVR